MEKLLQLVLEEEKVCSSWSCRKGELAEVARTYAELCHCECVVSAILRQKRHRHRRRKQLLNFLNPGNGRGTLRARVGFSEQLGTEQTGPIARGKNSLCPVESASATTGAAGYWKQLGTELESESEAWLLLFTLDMR
jgi:hypothetical protein